MSLTVENTEKLKKNLVKSPKKTHRNNSVELENLLQEFLEHQSKNGRFCIREKMKMLTKKFVPTTETAEEDPLEYFHSLTPYASYNRDLHYTKEMNTLKHSDIQNPDSLNVAILNYGIDTTASFQASELTRTAVPDRENYLSIRKDQNEDWAATSVATAHEYLSSNSKDKAIRAFSHAIEIDDTCWKAYLGLAQIHSSNQEWETCITNAMRCLELNGDCIEAFRILHSAIESSRLNFYRRNRIYEIGLEKFGIDKTIVGENDKKRKIYEEDLKTDGRSFDRRIDIAPRLSGRNIRETFRSKSNQSNSRSKAHSFSSTYRPKYE